MFDVSRRAVLSGIGIAGLAGAVGVSTAACGGPVAAFDSAQSPEDSAKRITAASEAQLIAAYAAVIAAIPSLAGELSQLKDQHAEHLAAMATSPEQQPSPPTVSTGTRDSALKDLRKLERSAATLRIQAAVATSDDHLIELFTRIGASEAAHAAYLSGVH